MGKSVISCSQGGTSFNPYTEGLPYLQWLLAYSDSFVPYSLDFIFRSVVESTVIQILELFVSPFV